MFRFRTLMVSVLMVGLCAGGWAQQAEQQTPPPAEENVQGAVSSQQTDGLLTEELESRLRELVGLGQHSRRRLRLNLVSGKDSHEILSPVGPSH